MSNDIYYKNCCISPTATNEYEVIFGHSENGVDNIYVAPFKSVERAKAFVDKYANNDFENDDDAYDYALANA